MPQSPPQVKVGDSRGRQLGELRRKRVRPILFQVPSAKHLLPDKGSCYEDTDVKEREYEEYIIRAAIHKGSFSSYLE